MPVVLDARGTEFTLDGEKGDIVVLHELFHLFLQSPVLDKFIERTGSIVFVFVVVSCHMEAVFINANGVGRAIHLCADVVFHVGECLDKGRLCLHACFICMGDVHREIADDSAACRGSFLDFPELYLQFVCNIHPFFRIAQKGLELAHRQQQPLGDLSSELHRS